jgi:hypothetical protein
MNAMYEDHDGTLWLAMDNQLLSYRDGKLHAITRRAGKPLEQPGEGAVFAVTEDVEHNIWALVATRTFSLVRIGDGVVQQTIPIPSARYARLLTSDSEGGLWIGTRIGYVFRYRNNALETMLEPADHEFRILHMFIDPTDAVWISTNRGIYRWQSGAWKNIGLNNGLPCDGINSSWEDDRGNLWVYSDCGLLFIKAEDLAAWWEHPSTKVPMTLFSPLDGLFAGDASGNSHVTRSPDGRLCFAATRGLQMIDPNHLYKNAELPPVHIEALIADRVTYNLSSSLRLPALTRDLEVDYTALIFVTPQRVRFRYKLDGRDTGWQDAGNRRQAFYNDLRQGKYTFHVIACNNDGLWNDVGAAIAFTIAPAWYQTTWF